MVFSSLVFLFLFLPLFFIVYFLLPGRGLKNLWLLAASLFFYAWGEPVYVLLMIFTIGINYLFALGLERISNKKLLLILAVACNLGLLGFFKYTDFVIGSINGLLGTQIPLMHISLPIGISFFIFQTLSYVIDVYRKEVKVQKNPLFLGAYVASFPQLIAGPIVRYQTIEQELTGRKETVEEFAAGARRFLMGLFKKIVIANHMGVVCDTILGYTAQEAGFAGAWVAVAAYTLQIYFDFSGYSDMAIGLGRMMGFHFLENFNYPYIATSITDFWRRWHISLSTFFRDYVYIPLGGNRVTKGRWLCNLLVVWLLTGLWHGANWNYVLWGLYYGVLLIIEKVFLHKYLEKAGKVLPHIYTMFLVMIGWALFRMEDMSLLGQYLGAMFGGYGAGSLEFFITNQVFQVKYLVALVLGILASTPIFKKWYESWDKRPVGGAVMDVALLFMFVISVFFLNVSGYNPFIYFKF